MARPPAAARSLAPEHLPNEPVCEGEAALATAIHAAVERFGPAADTIAGCGDRLDKLCGWLRSSKPWLWLAAGLVLSRTVNSAPDEVPNLISALAEILKAFQ